MRRWIIACAALVLAAAVGLTVWLLTRSDDGPTRYDTAKAAVVAACHADPARTPFTVGAPDSPGNYSGYAVLTKDDAFPILWVKPGGTQLYLAQVKHAGGGKFVIQTCGRKFGPPGFAR